METKIKNWFIWIILISSFTGFLDSLYLFLKKIFASPITCYVFEGCESVTNSSYSSVFGIPFSFFGILFYLVVFFFSVAYFQTKSSKIIKPIFYLSVFGILFAAYLFVLQIFVIEAYCIYCIASAVTSTLIFIFSLIAIKK